MTFIFHQPLYLFMENIGTGRVCVDKIGETDQTITMIVNGGTMYGIVCVFLTLFTFIAVTQLGALNMMLDFLPDTNSSCIDFDVTDDDIALEDPEEFIWTLEPVPIPRVELSINTTRVVIIDDDSELIQTTYIPFPVIT